MAADVKIFGIGEAVLNIAMHRGLKPALQADDVAGIGHGERLESDSVEGREKRGVDADSESEGEHGDGSKSGTVAQGADGVPKVCQEAVELRQAAELALGFLGLSNAAEGAARRHAGFFGRHPAANVILGDRKSTRLNSSH